MLHSLLSRYLKEIEQATIGCGAYVEHYTEEILTPECINLRIRLRFENGHLLEIAEAVVVLDDTLKHLDYRYHYQDRENQLLFRYDSTPHFPDLPGFPHHKHLPDAVIASEHPGVVGVIKEIMANET